MARRTGRSASGGALPARCGVAQPHERGGEDRDRARGRGPRWVLSAPATGGARSEGPRLIAITHHRVASPDRQNALGGSLAPGGVQAAGYR